ncbi:MAG: RNA-binding protein [Akkermansia sp.]
MDNDIIETKKITTDRKTFFIDLKSNARGRVIRITEKVGSNRDIIMVPGEILDEFIAALQEIKDANEQN